MQHNVGDVADGVALEERHAAAEPCGSRTQNLSLEILVVPCRALGKSEPKRTERAEDLEGLREDSKSRRAWFAPAPASAQAGLKHSP